MTPRKIAIKPRAEHMRVGIVLSRFNAAIIMPFYYRVDGLDRVGTLWRGKAILSAEQIEDIVAYLVTLRE
jgi:hypothetical protein